MTKRLYTLVVLACLIICQASAQTNTNEVLWKARKVNDYFMTMWPDPKKDTFVRNRKRPSSLWTRGVYYEGLVALYGIDRQQRYIDYIDEWAEYHKWTPRYGTKTTHADDQCCAQTYLDRYDTERKAKMIDSVRVNLEKQMASGRVDYWTWIDAFQMAMPVYSKMYRLTGDARYILYARDCYEWSRNVCGGGLLNKKEGLWWRDKDFVAPYKESDGNNCYWSRGNGWVVAAYVKAISDIKQTKDYAKNKEVKTFLKELEEDYLGMMRALLKCQREDGFWNVSLMSPVTYGGPETSGTALFLMGISWGIRTGMLPAKTYRQAADKAWKAMSTVAIHPNGFLGYLQGTGKQPSDGQPVTYTSVPDFEDYGAGCVLLGAVEYYKLLKEQPLTKTQARGGNNLWHDGTEMAPFFSNTKKVDIRTLGKQYVITDYGVKPDSTLLQTAEIQSVIDRCAKEGGGVVVIPEGTFLSGSLFFKQGTNLYVKGRLKGSDRVRDFRLMTTRMEGQTLQYFAALINADGIDGFCIMGDGACLNWQKAPSEEGLTMKNSTIDGNGYLYWEEFRLRRKYNKMCTNLEALRPRLVYLSNCKNVTVQDMNLMNSPFWTNHLYNCENVRYLDDFIYAPTKGVRPPGDSKEYGAPSSDAIDLDVCHDVLIDGCYMQVNDDAVVIKGGKGTWADTMPDNGPVYNILVQNCRYGRVHGCLTLGSESLHDWNIMLRNISISNADRVLWLKMRPDTPQHYESITVDGIKGTCGSFLVIRPWTQFFAPSERKDMPMSQCNDVCIKNIDVVCSNFFDVGTSDKYQLSDFTFQDCKVTDQAGAFDASMIKDTKVKNLNITLTSNETYQTPPPDYVPAGAN